MKLYGTATEDIHAGQALVKEPGKAVHITLNLMGEWNFRPVRPEHHEYPECTALVSAVRGQPMIAEGDE